MRDNFEVRETPPDLALYHGRFAKTTPKLHKIPIVGWDSEDDTRGKPLSFAFYSERGTFYTHSADEAIDYIYLYPDKAYFVAHNLEYDIGNLFKHCDYRYIDEMIYASKLLKATMIGTKHEFLNSSSFFAGPLSKMGKLIGLPKLEGNSLDPAYNIRDAQIPQVFMTQFQDRLHDKIGINLGVSIGQLSMAAYRAKYMTKKYQVTYNSPNCVGSGGQHGAYYGGRVEMFYKGIIQEEIKVADINSCYPRVMRDFPYPCTDIIEHSSILTHEYGIGKFTVKVPKDSFVPPLPYRSETGRLFFPTGTFTGWWTYAEVRYAMTLGTEIVMEHCGEGTNLAEYPFTDFINDFYGERLIHKKRLLIDENDLDALFNDLFLKLFQNNLYGKWCQHKPSMKMTRVRLSPDELAKLKVYKEFKVGPFYSYSIEREKPPNTANYLWGVYVTSYARIYLHKQIMEVHKAGGKIIYCDTDSVMFTGPSGAMKFGTELGEMSLETFDMGVFRQAKGYLLCNRVKQHAVYKSKGKIFDSRGECLNTHAAPIKSLSEFANYAGTQKQRNEYIIKKVACKGVPTHMALDFITKGAVRFLKPMRLKEASIRLVAKTNSKKDASFFNEVGVNYWREVEKEMKSIYIKRTGEKGVTMPIDASDIAAAEMKAYGKSEPLLNDMEEAHLTIKNKAKHVEVFRDVVVPKDWFDAKEAQQEERQLSSQKIHKFRKDEINEVPEGAAWFKGKITEQFHTKKGALFYKVLIKEYMGQKTQGKSLFGSISSSFFNENNLPEKIHGLTVAFYPTKDYLKNRATKVSVKIIG